MSLICRSVTFHSPYLPPVCAASTTATSSDRAVVFRIRDSARWRYLQGAFATMARCQPRVNSLCYDRGSRFSNLLDSFGKGFLGLSATAVVALSLTCNSPALAESLTVAFPASRAREVSYFYRTNCNKQLMLLYLQVLISL